MIEGISLGGAHPIGIGDAIQFTSLPENYYRTTGKKLVDVSHHWVFDKNPFVLRGVFPNKVHRLWERVVCGNVGEGPFRSNAEVWAKMLGVEVHTRRPNLWHAVRPIQLFKSRTLANLQGKSPGCF